MQGKVKTTLLLDAEVWRRFQRDVLRYRGGRALSAEVEKLIRGADIELFSTALAGVVKPPGGGLPSLEDVERARPRIRGRRRIADLIREDRDERDDRVLGLQRNREAVHRGRRHRSR